MNRFSQSLKEESEQQLRLIHSRIHDPISYCIESIQVAANALERLKAFTVQYKFANEKEEIEFFRDIKPSFTSKLIYYNEVYNIEASKPSGTVKMARKHYKFEIAKLNSFFANNLEFCRYYRSGRTDMDTIYFLRKKSMLGGIFVNTYFQTDHRFCTSHDYTLACLLANEEIGRYLEECLNKQSTSQSCREKPEVSVTWTGSKVALVELIYALHSDGVFNNSSVALKDLVLLFEQNFNISLGQYHKTFLEIRERKSERARFLSTLKEKLIARMDRTDDL